MASASHPWRRSFEDVGLDVGLLHRTSDSSQPISVEGQNMFPHWTSKPSPAVPESENFPVASSSTQSTPWLNHSPPSTDMDVPEAPASDMTSVADSGRPSFLRHPRSATLTSQRSSPLNPSSSQHPFPSPFPRPRSLSSAHIRRIASEESRALSMALPSSRTTSATSRGSMILYRRVDALDNILFPPVFPPATRNSYHSTSGDSFVSLSSDSKYPSRHVAAERVLIAYAYDPSEDDQDPADEIDLLHDPEGKATDAPSRSFSWRGFRASTVLLILISGLLALFVVYPVVRFYSDNGRNLLIVGNTRINSTGQAVSASFDPRSQIPIPPIGYGAGPQDARLRTSSDGVEYELVFSDEFNVDGRSFYEDNDLVWQADGSPPDRHQIQTQNGSLAVNADSLSSNSVFRLRDPVCLSRGFVEVGIVSAAMGVGRRIYWSGTWVPAEEESTMVPHGLSLTKTLLLELHFGVVGSDVGRSIPSLSTPGEVMVDYVRAYRRRTGAISSCEDVTPPVHVYVFLDLLDLP